MGTKVIASYHGHAKASEICEVDCKRFPSRASHFCSSECEGTSFREYKNVPKCAKCMIPIEFCAKWNAHAEPKLLATDPYRSMWVNKDPSHIAVVEDALQALYAGLWLESMLMNAPSRQDGEGPDLQSCGEDAANARQQVLKNELEGLSGLRLAATIKKYTPSHCNTGRGAHKTTLANFESIFGFFKTGGYNIIDNTFPQLKNIIS